MLPEQIVSIRDIGDRTSSYWLAATEDGQHLSVEPGETILWSGQCHVGQALPHQTGVLLVLLVITDRRTAWLTTNFDEGGGWAGFGAVGLAVSLTANAVSKRNAAKRTAGKVVIGQVRHEWLQNIALHRSFFPASNKKRAGQSAGMDSLWLDFPTVNGPGRVSLRDKPLNEEPNARWLGSVIADHRLGLNPNPSGADADILTRYRSGVNDNTTITTPNTHLDYWTLEWAFPGDTTQLIDLTRNPLETN